MIGRGLLCLALAGLGVAPARAEPVPAQRWVWVMTNLQVDERTEEVLRLIERAGKAGYNGLVLADYKLNILDRVIPRYFHNLQRVKDACARAKLEIIPCVCPIGYSAGLLAHDPNLAEGLPVKEAPFLVRGRTAVLENDPAPLVRNGGLEQAKGDRFTAFSYQDAPGVQTFVDRQTVHSGRSSCRMEHFGKASSNTRLIQTVKVRPWACYRLSVWVKTQALKPAGDFHLRAIGVKGKELSFEEVDLRPTQDWKKVELVFNSLDQEQLSVYAGVWGGKSGALWIDDLKLEPVGLVNVLRRPGCPFVVASADGRTVYTEGKDYEPVRDEQLGRRPNPGNYDFTHAGAVLRRTEESRIKDGDRLRVSWYHPVRTTSDQVMCCLSEPRVDEILRDQLQRVQKVLAPRTWFLQHDEIRVAGWCRACKDSGQTPGALLANNIKRCRAMVRKLNPQARLVIWSDMFDPHHNARDGYYLVNGTLKGSWEGLSHDMVIANWNSGKAADSLKWFASRGHTQLIAGYYDEPGNAERWRSAAKGVKGVTGYLYTTWQNRYDQLEAFARAMQGKP